MSIKYIFLSFALLCTCRTFAQDIRVHDPVMIRQHGMYYLFCTGMGISMFSSPDMKDWRKEASVFDSPPAWAVEAVPGFKGHIWAPDISYYNGQYYLYYSVSAFGKNTSCIGLATNNTLDVKDPQYKWIDHGKVIQSIPGRDLWNAIDPNLVMDEENTPWLSFGSFWAGMKLVKMDKDLRKIAEPQEWHTISKRERSFTTQDENPGKGAVEAPFIFKKNDYYYLFVSFDFCCRGPESTYKVVIGRAKDVKGPYLDKAGTRMDEGGGTMLVQGNENYFGVGHNAAYTFEGTDYLVMHGYSAADEGKPRLVIKEMTWDEEGWPEVSMD